MKGPTLTELYVSLAAVGGLLLLLGMLGGLLKERTPVSEPLIALLAGVLIGPAALGLLDLADLGDQTLILEEAALVTLGVALVGVALRLPVGYSSSNWRLLVVLLGIVMPLMWLVGGLLAYLILGVPFWVAVLIGAIVTPTDPVVASSIVAGGSPSATCPRPQARHLLRVRLQRRAGAPLRRAARAGAHRASGGGARPLADPHGPPGDRRRARRWPPSWATWRARP